ncbi:MAG: hypothetical protein QM651_13765, partial [Rhodoblastus sp.]
MSNMNFQLVLELITKGLDGFNKAAQAEKDMAAAGKAANDKTVEAAKKAEAAVNAEMKAIEGATAAMKAEEAAAKAAADAQAQAANESQKSVSILQRLANASRAAGAGMSSAFHKAAAGAASVGRSLRAVARDAMGGTRGFWRTYGAGMAKEFAKGLGAGIKAELPNILKGVLGGMFGGVGLMSGPGALRSNVQVMTQRAISGGAAASRAASAMAYSNVQGALNVEEQIRPDLGVEGAARYRAAADAYLKGSPFRRDDVRAALPDAAKAGVMPGTAAWKAIMDAAASQNVSPQQAMAAYAAAKKGDMSGLEAFGIKGKTDDAGKVTGLSFMADGKQQDLAVAGNVDQQIIKAIEARFAGAGDRKSMSTEGVMTRVMNQWDAFVGKVMDSGPYQFINEKFSEIFKSMELDGGGAQKLGATITQAMKTASDVVKDVYQTFKTIEPAVTSVVNALGGWKIAIEGVMVAWLLMKGVALAGSVAGMVGGILSLTAALGPAAAAAWAFAAALIANPVTWIVAGILALAAAAYLVYQNWSTIGPMLAQAWAGVKAAASAAWEGIKTAISSAWEGVKASISDAWNGMKGIVSDALDGATTAIRDWGGTALAAMQSAFGKVKGWFDSAVGGLASAWDSVKNAASSALSYVGLGKDATPEEKQAAERQRAIADGAKAADAVALLKELQGLLPSVASAAASFDLAAPISTAINAARGAIAGQSFYAEGVALMSTLAAGIEAGAAKAVAAVRNVAQQMRDHLPHSPAKVGPLSDLDQVRFSETLASAIRPDPAVAAVRNVAAGMAAAIGDGPQ